GGRRRVKRRSAKRVRPDGTTDQVLPRGYRPLAQEAPLRGRHLGSDAGGDGHPRPLPGVRPGGPGPPCPVRTEREGVRQAGDRRTGTLPLIPLRGTALTPVTPSVL